jgi:tRNA uridine 5-carboxymethylaminomethyl modification enzyme
MTTTRAEASYDVIVVGGGHAGTEAAVAAARALATVPGVRAPRVALVTSTVETIGQMSCNPAIGGVAKGTVVREIDALGGVMGRATDRATLQFRMLNRGKGPAVWAPRAQADRGLYRRAVRTLVESHAVAVVQGTVRRLLFAPGDARVAGVETMEGRRFHARAVVITTGTFLRGRIHIGVDSAVPGGRSGEAATTHLAEQLADVGLVVERFKTGTPPRIDGRSVDYARCERQDSELADFDYRWSVFEARDVVAPLPQLPCWITHAAAATKTIVSDHIGESAMYGGAIGARGPRYCPSIEDKVVRFPDAERHQLFLEPEGFDTHELYVNGLSTSLPAAVQLEMLRSIRGLEQVAMTRAGYAIEYDYYPPTQLHPSLEVRRIAGLFFAGQINGTTGYEEAGGQGVLAGINAARSASALAPVILGRESSYIGVLVDDLVTRGVDEPYRLFTSRSEFRLTVRQDNALARLAEVALAAGMYTDDERRVIDRRDADEARALRLANETSARPDQVDTHLIATGTHPLAHAVRVAELTKRNGTSLATLFALTGVGADLPRETVTTVELELKYEGYFARERRAADRLRALGDYALPEDAPYDAMHTLSIESRQKLATRRPTTLAQAASIPGVSPADLQNLVLELERSRN